MNEPNKPVKSPNPIAQRIKTMQQGVKQLREQEMQQKKNAAPKPAAKPSTPVTAHEDNSHDDGEGQGRHPDAERLLMHGYAEVENQFGIKVPVELRKIDFGPSGDGKFCHVEMFSEGEGVVFDAHKTPFNTVIDALYMMLGPLNSEPHEMEAGVKVIEAKSAGKAKWSEKVTEKEKFHPKAGIFDQSARKIADYFRNKDASKATQRVNFYLQRAGKNLSPEAKKRLKDAIQILKDKEE